jgi:hypothetical protein
MPATASPQPIRGGGGSSSSSMRSLARRRDVHSGAIAADRTAARRRAAGRTGAAAAPAVAPLQRRRRPDNPYSFVRRHTALTFPYSKLRRRRINHDGVAAQGPPWGPWL